MSRKLILTATAVAALGAAAPAAHAAFPGQNGPILFAGSTSTEQQAILSMPFGGPAAPLLQTQGWADGIESSADGRRIVYNDEFVIWTANADGSVSLLGAVTDGGRRFDAALTTDTDERILRADCTCNWHQQNRLRKGPCEHILALRLARARHVV